MSLAAAPATPSGLICHCVCAEPHGNVRRYRLEWIFCSIDLNGFFVVLTALNCFSTVLFPIDFWSYSVAYMSIQKPRNIFAQLEIGCKHSMQRSCMQLLGPSAVGACWRSIASALLYAFVLGPLPGCVAVGMCKYLNNVASQVAPRLLFELPFRLPLLRAPCVAVQVCRRLGTPCVAVQLWGYCHICQSC